MGWTYTTLTSALSNWLEISDTEFTQELDNIIMLAENRLYRDADLDVFRKYATADTVAGARFLEKPADIVVDRWMNITVNGEKTYLYQREPSFIASYWPDPTSDGVPAYYADWDEEFFVMAPTPDAIYTVELAYTYRPTGLSSSNTTTWMGTNAPDALFAACMVEALFLSMGDENDKASWEARYQQALARLQREEMLRQRRDENRSGVAR